MSMDQIEGLEPIHENWGDVDLGESDPKSRLVETRFLLLPCLPVKPAVTTFLNVQYITYLVCLITGSHGNQKSQLQYRTPVKNSRMSNTKGGR